MRSVVANAGQLASPSVCCAGLGTVVRRWCCRRRPWPVNMHLYRRRHTSRSWSRATYVLRTRAWRIHGPLLCSLAHCTQIIVGHSCVQIVWGRRHYTLLVCTCCLLAGPAVVVRIGLGWTGPSHRVPCRASRSVKTLVQPVSKPRRAFVGPYPSKPGSYIWPHKIKKFNHIKSIT